MQGLLKFTFLSFVFCLNLFAFDYPDVDYDKYLNVGFPRSIAPYESKPADVEILTSEYLRYDNVIYKYSISYTFFDYSLLKSSGFFAVYNSGNFNSIVRYDSSFGSKRIACEKRLYGALSCYIKNNLDDPNMVIKEFSYYESYSLTRVGQCNPDENFNTSTGKCQKCPDGQSWNQNANSCFVDCTDDKTNKYGWADGSCTDCSSAKTVQEIYRCFCGSLGLGVPETLTDVGVIGKPGYFLGKCSNGYSFEYKDPDYKPDPKPDDNKTKPDDPKPDDNKTKPDDPGSGNNNDTDKDFCKKNPNSPKCKKDDDVCKKNPNDPKCKKNDNNTTIPGPDNAKFNPADFDIKELGKEMGSFEKAYKGAFSKIEKEFEGAEGFNAFKNGIDQFINNLKGKGLNDISKKSVPKSCSHKETIDFFGYNVVMDFDFCKIVEPASDAFYYLFYVFFFGCFLFLIIKFLIFSF